MVFPHGSPLALGYGVEDMAEGSEGRFLDNIQMFTCLKHFLPGTAYQGRFLLGHFINYLAVYPIDRRSVYVYVSTAEANCDQRNGARKRYSETKGVYTLAHGHY